MRKKRYKTSLKDQIHQNSILLHAIAPPLQNFSREIADLMHSNINL